MKRLFAVMCLAAVLPASAQVYKCKVNGKTVYADAPCGGAKSAVMDIRQDRAVQTASAASTQEALAEKSSKVDKMIKRRQLQDDIDRSESYISSLHSQREREMNALRAKKMRANNNLAGAVWEQSISAEMNAVTSKYDSKVKSEQSRLDNLRDQLAQLDK